MMHLVARTFSGFGAWEGYALPRDLASSTMQL